MTTYGYRRVSTFEQVDRSSLDEQERRIRGAALIRNVSDVEIVTDAGVSGSIALADRPAGGAMVSSLRTGDTVIAAKLDRMFRDACDALSTAERFKKRGVALIMTDMGTEPVTESGVARMSFGVLALMAEFERARMLERMNEGRRGKKSKGGHIGGLAPYGYAVEGAGREATLLEVVGETRLVATVRTLRDEARSYREIGAILEDRGFRNRRGNPFDPAQIRRMVERPLCPS